MSNKPNTATAEKATPPAVQQPTAVRPEAAGNPQYTKRYEFQGMGQSRTTRDDYWNDDPIVVAGSVNEKLGITNIQAYKPTQGQADKGSVCKVNVTFAGVILVKGFNVATSQQGRLYVDFPYRSYESNVKKNGKNVLDGEGKPVMETRRANDIIGIDDATTLSIKHQILKALEPFIRPTEVAQAQQAAQEADLKPSDVVG